MVRGNIFSLLALLGSFVLPFLAFGKLPARIAIVVCYIGVLLFGPMDQLSVVPFIEYNKLAAVALGLVFAVVVFDSERVSNLSLHLVDLPVLLWCSSGVLTSLANGLGLYDGLSAASNTVLLWGVPYFLGRLYFSDPQAAKILIWGLIFGGTAYVLPILFELAMSPQLHRMVYGYMQHSFAQVIRGGGYRPMVFMQHGIMLGTWISFASLAALWSWYSGALPKKIGPVPIVLFVVLLPVITVLCKSMGAIGLFVLGLVTLYISTKIKFPVFLVLLVLIPPAYFATRATGLWDGQNLVDLVAEKISQDRADSLNFRFENENILVEKALERPVFGWGGWGRSRVYDPETGEDISTTDGFWVITLGTRGYFGLLGVSLVLLMPAVLFLLKVPARVWNRPQFGPSAVLMLLPLLLLIDSLLNSMINPVYILMAGGMSGLLTHYSLGHLEGVLLEGQGGSKGSADAVLQSRGPARGRGFVRAEQGLHGQFGFRQLVMSQEEAAAQTPGPRSRRFKSLTGYDNLKETAPRSKRHWTEPGKPTTRIGPDSLQRAGPRLVAAAERQTRIIMGGALVKEVEIDAVQAQGDHLITEEQWVRVL